MKELLLHVDESDKVIGPVERLKAHLDEGILHRGLMVVVMNDDNDVLLTQRSVDRPDLGFPPPFPSFWDITIAGHPKWGQADYVTQMKSEVWEELGIEVTEGAIEYAGEFQYHAPDPSYPNHETAPTFKLSEREICGVGVLRTNGNPTLNSIELKSSMWVQRKDMARKLRSLKVSPWALLMIERFPQVLKG